MVIYEIYFLVAHFPRWYFIEWENDGDLIYLHRAEQDLCLSLLHRYIFLWHIGWEQDICLSLKYISLWHIFRNSGNSVGKCIACNVWWDAWTFGQITKLTNCKRREAIKSRFLDILRSTLQLEVCLTCLSSKGDYMTTWHLRQFDTMKTKRTIWNQEGGAGGQFEICLLYKIIISQ